MLQFERTPRAKLVIERIGISNAYPDAPRNLCTFRGFGVQYAPKKVETGAKSGPNAPKSTPERRATASENPRRAHKGRQSGRVGVGVLDRQSK